ncbi:hypothetical protein V6N13_120973 [Hibiscus sabdariffa]
MSKKKDPSKIIKSASLSLHLPSSSFPNSAFPFRFPSFPSLFLSLSYGVCLSKSDLLLRFLKTLGHHMHMDGLLKER